MTNGYPDADDVRATFTYRRPNDAERAAMERINELVTKLGVELVQSVPAGSHQDHAMADLEAVRMWANAGIIHRGGWLPDRHARSQAWTALERGGDLIPPTHTARPAGDEGYVGPQTFPSLYDVPAEAFVTSIVGRPVGQGEAFDSISIWASADREHGLPIELVHKLPLAHGFVVSCVTAWPRLQADGVPTP